MFAACIHDIAIDVDHYNPMHMRPSEDLASGGSLAPSQDQDGLGLGIDVMEEGLMNECLVIDKLVTGTALPGAIEKKGSPKRRALDDFQPLKGRLAIDDDIRHRVEDLVGWREVLGEKQLTCGSVRHAQASAAFR